MKTGITVLVALLPIIAHAAQSKILAVDEIPPLVASADKTVQLITWPVENGGKCLPQCYVLVRVIEGKVVVSDVSLYKNRKPWFGDGLIEFRDGDKVGFVDSHGKVVIPPRFDSARHFSCGLAVVEVGKKSGFIKKDGAWLIEPNLDSAHDFENGFASASKAGRYGILNTEGKWHLQPEFIRLDPLVRGWFAVRA